MNLPVVEAVPTLRLPERLELYYGDQWHESAAGLWVSVDNPGTGEILTQVAHAGAEDMDAAAAQVDFFAGLVTELPFNHTLMFCAGKTAAILAAGNAVILKPAEQTPLSALQLAELIGPLFPRRSIQRLAW